MTAELFHACLQDLDIKMIRKNQKILLFIDHCPTHPKNAQLQNARVEFLPPNVTSKLQPPDQGIIKVLKQYYRKRLVLQLVVQIDKLEKNASIALLDAMNFLTSAWEAVSTSTIVNCFGKAGLRHQRLI